MTTEIALSDNDLYTAIFGSGADIYPWYDLFDTAGYDSAWVPNHTNARIRIRMADVHEQADLAIGRIRRAIDDLVRDGNPTVSSVDWSDPECDSDVDANIADCIIQYAVLGEVMFG